MRIASSTPPILHLENENETDEDSIARQTEEFLAHFAYTVENENDDWYLSPDEETVHITANTVFGSQHHIEDGYLHPDSATQLAQSNLDEFLENFVYGSPNDSYNGEFIQIGLGRCCHQEGGPNPPDDLESCLQP